MKHGDFIVYVDESGDHSLASINPRYPVFVLALCVMHKDHYTHHIAPALRALKFTTFGHDMVIFHESDIRKRIGAFAGMTRERCGKFLNDLTDLIEQARLQLVAVVIDKKSLLSQRPPERPRQPHAYHLAVGAALEVLFRLLRAADQDSCVTHVVCEARGRTEDRELAEEFKRLCEVARYAQRGIRFELVIADKKTNSEGLQLADLMARPIGLHALRPDQPNRAVGVTLQKIAKGREGIGGSDLVRIP